ncbi:MAG: flagellar protein FlaG [Candidatus Kapabacteria bacterium]|nr:flagellar protein FlaG [Ignavibacteriota bacterium]MCW5884000.1 flagellar protein FlaG [Candidatus Kapabacteria bacterium]
MISAISGLPDLMIDKQNDVQIEIEMNNRARLENSKINGQPKSDSETQKVEVKEKKYNQESIDDLNRELRGILEGNQLNVEFKFEKEANQLIMKLIDQETQEVVRQMPPEIMLKIAKIVSNQIGSGALADAKV